MALEGKFFAETFNAGADLSAAANQYKIVKIDTAAPKQVILVATLGARGDGVLVNKPGLNQPAEVACNGALMKALCGAAVATAGIELTPDATGRLIGAVSTNQVFGISVSVTGAANEMIEFLRVSYVKP